ncbi:YgeY family selenium metabolism-linked hydrolase [Candidatus Sumerlaeota bacterium]|nr:YgeY family selenium metabolism-linked hydrolase [Candidatus Sumerlaeota bacterium]
MIRNLVKENSQSMTNFLRDLIAIPSTSGNERQVAQRILLEMENLGFDEAYIDDYGSVIGRMGRGKPCLLYDGHIDTVDVADPSSWDFDPYRGKIQEGYIWGRGASDNKAAPVVQIYGLKILKEISGEAFPATVYVVGSVQEEACDGLALGHVIRQRGSDIIDGVVLGECTGCKIYRGHRGRMEIMVSTSGVSAHASAPERGENAIYNMAGVIREIEELNHRLKDDPFLGKGSIAVTKIECDTDSINCIPYGCRIYIDRRLTVGEDRESALREIRSLSSAKKADVKILRFNDPSYTGLALEQEKYYPTWVLPEDHALVHNAVKAYKNLFGTDPQIGRWTFSTNGVSSMGELGVPTIGFGPSLEEYAHSNQDRCSVEDLETACSFYAALPLMWG